MENREIAYFNGHYTAKSEIRISPDDRAFYFGDAVYEVVRFYSGVPLYFTEHLERLARSLHEIKIKFDTISSIEQIVLEVIERNKLVKEDVLVYIQVSRGDHPRTHMIPKISIIPNVYISVRKVNPNPKDSEEGIPVITRPDIRWLRCDIKSIQLLPNTMAFQEAIERNAKETVFYRGDFFTEASHTNFFGVKNKVLFTHPLNNFILPGITRQITLNIAKKLHIGVVEKPINVSETIDFQEFFITGTSNEITPVIKIDSTIISSGKPGIITRKIQDEFFSLVKT